MAISFSTVSPFLPESEKVLLISNPADKWVPILKSTLLPVFTGKKIKKQKKEYKKTHPGYKNEYIKSLINVANAIIRTDWTKSPEATKILKKLAEKKLKKIPEVHHAEFVKIKRAFEGKHVVPPNSLSNVGATCWMNTLLQHFRSTQDFEGLLAAQVNPHFQGAAAANLTQLQQKLNFVVTELRQKSFVKDADLKELAALFATCNIPLQDAHRQQDVTVIIDLLFNRFGPIVASIQKKRCRVGFEDVMEPSYAFIPIRTAANGQTTTQMLTDELSNHTAEVRNPANGRNEPVRFDYKISNPPTLQLRVNRVGDNNPVIEQRINIRPFAFVDEDQFYNLGRVMCSTTAKKFGTAADATTYESKNGHYFYYQKVGGAWVKYDDSSVTRCSNDAVQADFDAYAYAAFYYRE